MIFVPCAAISDILIPSGVDAYAPSDAPRSVPGAVRRGLPAHTASAATPPSSRQQIYRRENVVANSAENIWAERLPTIACLVSTTQASETFGRQSVSTPAGAMVP